MERLTHNRTTPKAAPGEFRMEAEPVRGPFLEEPPFPWRPGESGLGDGMARLREIASRRWRTFVAIAVVTFVVVQLAAFFWPGTFAAHAALLIQKPRAAVTLASDPGQGPTVVSSGVTEEEVNSEIAILTSREVLSATVGATGLDRIPPPLYVRIFFAPLRWYEKAYSAYHGVPAPTQTDRAIQGLGRSVSAERMKASNVIVVTMESRDPRAAEAILDELLRRYFSRHIEVLGRDQMAPLFSSQAGVIEGKLQEEEDALQKSKSEGGTVDPAAERDVQMKIDATLREEVETLRRRLAELDGKAKSLGKTESQWVKGREAKVSLENERLSAIAERDGALERMRVLERQAAASRLRLIELDRRAIDTTRTQRRVKALEDRYLSYLSRSEQGRIDSALDQNRVTNVTLVQAAAALPSPVSPKRMVVLVVSVVGGLLLALLVCLWLELRSVGAASVLEAVVPARSGR
jgi:uncharacterized protein involved in exopolysaccharide biosynthesis